MMAIQPNQIRMPINPNKIRPNQLRAPAAPRFRVSADPLAITTKGISNVRTDASEFLDLSPMIIKAIIKLLMMS